MKPMQMRKSSNKLWSAVFAAVIIGCTLFIILFKNIGARTAVIYKDGQEITRVDLSRVTESYTIPLDGNVISVEPGTVRMLSADCPDQICVHQGTLHDAGRIVCLPNRVLIEMERTKDAPDAKAG